MIQRIRTCITRLTHQAAVGIELPDPVPIPTRPKAVIQGALRGCMDARPQWASARGRVGAAHERYERSSGFAYL